MKFGRNFHRFQVPEWAPFYINYNGSKKLFKIASKLSVERGVDADFTELFAALSRDIDNVEAFYWDKYAIIQQEVMALYNYYGVAPDFFDTMNLDQADQYELQDLLGAFIELREGMKKLQWYGKVNRDGFRRILRKLDKFRSGSGRYLYEEEPKLSNSQFASQSRYLKDLERTNRSITSLSLASFQGSIHTSLFLENFRSRFDPPLIPLDAVYHAIREGDASTLDQILQEQASVDRGPSTDFQALLLALLRCSILWESGICIDKLLSQMESLQNDNLVNYNHYLHRLVIKIGRKKTLRGPQDQESHLQEPTGPTNDNEESPSSLAYILDRLRPSQRRALQEKDSFGRLPLHYAAQYGLVETCRGILKHMQDWGQLHASTALEATLLQDSAGYTPLHLGVIGGHTMVTKTLLEFHQMGNTQNSNAILGTLLAIALKSNFVEIVQLLVTTNIDINHQDKYGETALYIAAQTHREDCVKILIKALSDRKADIDVLETVYGWTPLFIACVEGHLPIVELLLQAGANQGIRDLSGWTAKDHAAFRGHIHVAERLRGSSAGEPASVAMAPGLRSTYAMRQGEENMILTPNLTRTFGRYPPTNEIQIFVNLGSLDSNKDVMAVDLSPYLSPNSYTPQPETGFSIEICAIGASGSSQAIQLPILEDMTNDPWLFLANDLSEIKLVFNIRATTNTERDGIIIGSGIALLENFKQGLGPKRESLIRDYTIPILEKDTLMFMGTVTFSFVMVLPFPHPSITPTTTQDVWKEAGPTKVVGHRGLGQNVAARNRLQLGENTIQSFLKAVDLGASYVEFDVQLTKDHVPVIYHDFLLSETGTGAPMHTLTLEQFMYLSKAQSHRGDLPSMAETRYLERFEGQVDHGRRSRSRSLNTYEDYRTKDLVERMKRTFEFKHKGFKGNTMGDYVQESFTTLEELLEKLPESIEYPMLFETDHWKMDTYAIELNTFVDAVLDKIYSLGANRAIIFSSFSPEICILLSIKQRSYPVMFLSDAGTVPTGDVRASSLQEAVHFAKSWNLSGIVMASEPFVMCPRLVKYVKDSKLVCASYGTLNNDPKNAKIQAEAGLDAIIVDNVRLIAETLSGAVS